MHKEVRKAVDYATKQGFTVKRLNGHTWGWIVCTCGKHEQVFCTARDPEGGARKIKKWVDKHKEHLQ